MLREQNRGVAGVGRGTLIFFPTDPWTLGGVSRSLELNTPSKVLDMLILTTKKDPIEAQGGGLDLGDTL
jgi:hypothetical protein